MITFNRDVFILVVVLFGARQHIKTTIAWNEHPLLSLATSIWPQSMNGLSIIEHQIMEIRCRHPLCMSLSILHVEQWTTILIVAGTTTTSSISQWTTYWILCSIQCTLFMMISIAFVWFTMAPNHMRTFWQFFKLQL